MNEDDLKEEQTEYYFQSQYSSFGSCINQDKLNDLLDPELTSSIVMHLDS
jgi:hypothetical protein